MTPLSPSFHMQSMHLVDQVSVAMAAPSVGRAFAGACRRESPENLRQLREAVAKFVSALATNDFSVEQIIVALKSAIATYGDVHVRPSLVTTTRSPDAIVRARVYSRVFCWTLATYYPSPVT